MKPITSMGPHQKGDSSAPPPGGTAVGLVSDVSQHHLHPITASTSNSAPTTIKTSATSHNFYDGSSCPPSDCATISLREWLDPTAVAHVGASPSGTNVNALLATSHPSVPPHHHRQQGSRVHPCHLYFLHGRLLGSPRIHQTRADEGCSSIGQPLGQVTRAPQSSTFQPFSPILGHDYWPIDSGEYLC